MAATQTLQTIISINARTGNGFSEVGATLTELGTMVNGISQELINFGKDSIGVYRDYEKSMKDAEVALSTTYGRGTKELGNVMAQLDVSATEWAASTIFHTNDVANAISEAAHAGWDYNQIMSGIPAAMQLAQAGGLDLSEAVNYIVKSANAAGIEFGDMADFIDLWTFAANSSASTIGEFGDAMLRMGSTMRFAGSTEELMTLIAVTANAGSVGSEAGTLVRNSIMRLIAPTEKAKEAMELLGATSEETAGLMDDQALAAANAELAAHGFSAYSADTGELKNILDIYRELYVALGDIAGGYENIDRNQDALQVLSAIFPTRTITEALTLLRGAAEEYDGLYEAMAGGAAAGYGEYAAETQMDSLYGRIETFYSKVERLKQLVGEELSGQLSDALGGLGDIVDNIANLDEGKLGALVSGLEVVGAAGPSLIAAGTAFRFIGSLLTPAGAVGMGVVTLTALAAAVEKLDEADFSSGFGLAEMDHQAISGYLSGLSEDFEGAYEQIDAFRQAVDDSVTSYTTASQTFTGDLLTSMLTGATLTGADISKLESLGSDMHDAVISGIENSTAGSMSYFELLFGGAGKAEANPEYQDIIDLTNSAYEDSIAQAEQIGQDIRAAMTGAFADGQVSEEEYQDILSYVQSYNEALAQAAAEAKSEQDYIEQQKLFHRAQTASLDEIDEVAGEVQAERERVLSEAEDTYLGERFKLEYRYNRAIENGTLVNGQAATEERRDAALAALEQQYQQHILEQGEQYDNMLYQLWDSQIQQSDYAEAYNQLGEYADRVLSGDLAADSAYSMFKEQFGGANGYAGEIGMGGSKTRQRISEMLAQQISEYGGYEGLAERVSDYREKGDTAAADRLLRLYAMQQINDNFAKTSYTDNVVTSSNGINGYGYLEVSQAQRGDFLSVLSQAGGTYTVENARKTADALSSIGTFFEMVSKVAQGEAGNADLSETSINLPGNDVDELDNIVQQLGQNYNLDRVLEDTAAGTPFADAENAMREYYAAYQLIYGELSKDAEQYRIQVIPEVDPDVSVQLDPVPLPIEPHVEGEDSISALQDQGVQVQVEGDTQQLQATIDGVDGQDLMTYVDGDVTGLSMKISDQDGKTLVENVTGNAASLAAIINSYNGRTVTVNITGRKLFAAGGRATSASVFGEDGPEWAIPEEHSERTADLLNAARAASGFTWPELLQRYGGLNAGTGTGSMMLVYSPVINAKDAAGVEEALQEDKKRFERWYEEKMLHDGMEVYQ